jgi:hypothetical protein
LHRSFHGAANNNPSCHVLNQNQKLLNTDYAAAKAGANKFSPHEMKEGYSQKDE